MLGSHSQSAQESTERSRPRSRLLVMKERLRLQRQQCRQQTGRDSQTDEAKQHPTSESYPIADHAQEPSSSAVQAPIKGRRFQRSRHAEQQARSRSQDAVTTGVKKDGFLGCTGEARPLQKSKSVEMNLEKITRDSDTNRRSNTVSVEVGKLAASGSRKVEKKGSFLFRSSSLIARLSGRSGQKKLQSPSPLRHDGSQSALTENLDDSIGASANQSGTSSEAGRLEVLTSSDSVEVDGGDFRQQAVSTVTSICQPTVVSSQPHQTAVASLKDRRVCNCSAFVRNSGIPLSHADSKGHENTSALDQGSEIVFAAEMRRCLPRQTNEDWMISHTHTEDCCCQHGKSQTATKLTGMGRPVSISAGNLLNKVPQVREDVADNDVRLNGVAATSTMLHGATMTSCDAASLDAASVTATTAHEQHSEYSY